MRGCLWGVWWTGCWFPAPVWDEVLAVLLLLLSSLSFFESEWHMFPRACGSFSAGGTLAQERIMWWWAK